MLPRGHAGFFHYDLKWVVAEPGRVIGLAKSHYINRIDGREREAGSPAEQLSGYLNRDRETQSDELGPHLLITRGLPVRTGAELAWLLDARERKKDRSYRRYGGQLPRVACHAILSFRYGTSVADAERALNEHARLLSDRLRVPVEARIHLEDLRPDHAHMLIGTRIVENGELGCKQRSLDAVSEKHDGQGLTIDGRVLGSTIEMLRSDWAERMRQISGDSQIDHRSYVRRGLPISPVKTVARSDIEYERRRGRETWREKRRLELRERDGYAAEAKMAEEADAGTSPPEWVNEIVVDISREAVREAVAQRIDAVAKIWGQRKAPPAVPPGYDGPEALGDILGDIGVDASTVVQSLLAMEAEKARLGRDTLGKSERVTQRIDAVTKIWGLRKAPRAVPSGYGGLDAIADILGDIGVDASTVVQSHLAVQAEKARLERDAFGKSESTFDRFRSPFERVDNGELRPQPISAEPEEPDRPESGLLRGARLASARAARKELQRQHRLTEGRERTLAGLAGVEVAMLAEIETDDDPKNGATGQAQPDAASWPPDLLAHWVTWKEEDRKARAARRQKKDVGHETIGLVSATSVSTSARPAEPKTSRSDQAMGSPALAVPPPAPKPQPPRPRPPRDDLTVDIVRALDVNAGPGAIERSVVLARALGDAQAADITARACNANRQPLAADALMRAVAQCLRASGQDREEVGFALRARQAAGGPSDSREVARAVDFAYSERSTAWLEERPNFCARAAQISQRTEMAVYRQMRKTAMEQIKRDLDEVWTTRNARLEEVKARHRRDMAMIRDLRWRNRKLQHRGLLLAILSVAIERAILRPLLGLERLTTAQERQDLTDAAKAATERLRALRDEWRTAVGVVRRPITRQGAQVSEASREVLGSAPVPVQKPTTSQGASRQPIEAVGETAAMASAAPSMAQVPSGTPAHAGHAAPDSMTSPPGQVATVDTQPVVTPSDPSNTAGMSLPNLDARRRLVRDYAVVLLARHVWSKDRGRSLAELVGLSDETLEADARAAWRDELASKEQDAKIESVIALRRRRIVAEATEIDFHGLLALMDGFARGAKKRNEDSDQQQAMKNAKKNDGNGRS